MNWPIWLFVFFIAPGPLTVDLFDRGFDIRMAMWLAVVVAGTTIAGLLGNKLYLVQVGDSRAYMVRGGVAQQITKDQSLMQRLIEAGELTPEEAEHSERRNIIDEVETQTQCTSRLV